MQSLKRAVLEAYSKACIARVKNTNHSIDSSRRVGWSIILMKIIDKNLVEFSQVI